MPIPLHPYRMAWSFKIGSLFGIDVRIHLIFPVFIAWFCLANISDTKPWMDLARNLLNLLLLFGFVLLHELGHSLVAQRSGIRVRDITLWPLGGLARLEGQARTPATEIFIALAGPAVNLGLALAVLPFLYLISFPERSFIQDLLALVLFFNVVMGLFNLLPAFPTDGGRILRAYLARHLSYQRATEIAVSVGRILVFTGIVVVYILWKPHFGVAVIVGLFLLWAGSSELKAVRVREFLRRAGTDFGDGSPTILDAEVISSHPVDPDDKSGEEDPEPGSLNSHLKPFEREFIEQVRRYKKKEE